MNTNSRRDFLKAMGATGLCAMASSSEFLAQDSPYKPISKGGCIDVHHHHQPPGLNPFGGRGGGGRPAWTPERSLEQMDKFGIGVAILSLTQMGDVLYDNTEKGRTAVRKGNDYGAKCMHDWPKKFGLFAAIPFPDVDASLKEIEYAYDTLKCDGIGIYTNDNQGHWPGDPKLEPIWKELGRRKAIVYMHPWVPGCCNNLNYGATSFMNEIDFETTRAVTSLITNGVMFRYPDIKLITAHSGGTLPVLAGRMKDRYPQDKVQYIPNGLWAEFKKLYYDCAHATYKMPWAALTALVPPSQYLFGTDYALEPIESTVNEIPGLKIPRDVLEMMERKNAERLLPRFKA